MDDKKVKREELKTGDILLLTPIPGNWEGKLISRVTDAPVSHTVMVYYDTSYVIEENEPQVQINELQRKVANRSAYVLRHKDRTLDINKVIDIAKECCEKEIPFAKKNLYVVGIYFLVMDIAKGLTVKLQELLTNIFHRDGGINKTI